jgi:SAM-dependent methyltransferase
LLDLGCGDGALLVLARKYGCARAIGIETNSTAASYGVRRYGLEIWNCTAETIPCGAGEFDVVTGFDIIEHVRRPAALFAEVSRVLKAGGRFIGSCPDMRCFDEWGGAWSGVQRNMEHVSYFDERSLSHLARCTGLRLELLEHEGFPLEMRSYRHSCLFVHGSLAHKLTQPFVASHNAIQKARVAVRKFLRGLQCGHEIRFVLAKSS